MLIWNKNLFVEGILPPKKKQQLVSKCSLLSSVKLGEIETRCAQVNAFPAYKLRVMLFKTNYGNSAGTTTVLPLK